MKTEAIPTSAFFDYDMQMETDAMTFENNDLLWIL